MTENYVRIGAITKTHGLQGGVKVYPTTDDESRFAVGTKCLLHTKERDIPVTMAKVSRFKKLFIVVFEEFGDINEVEGFKGCDLWIERDEAGVLEEDTYYIDDLIDMEVVDENGVSLGHVAEVIATGANDVYVVRGAREILIPAIHDCILDVSVEEGVMRVHLLDGL